MGRHTPGISEQWSARPFAVTFASAMPDPPRQPYPPANDPPPPWSGVVARAISQLEERIDARLDLLHQELALLRQIPEPQSPVAASDTVPPASVRVKAGASKVLPWLGYAALLLGAAQQIAAGLKPGLVGPIQALLDLVKGLSQ